MSTDKHCLLCLSTADDELNYGLLFTREDFAVHHYCLLFAPGLPQNGMDEEGIEGFLIPDIKKEKKRIRLLKCLFCHKKGANLGCCQKNCPRAYHTKCALKNDLFFEFTSHFQTFCKKHKNITQKDEKDLDNICSICYEKLDKTYPHSILIPCCKNSWFHKRCLQKYALTAGCMHFKCPLCGNKSIEELKLLGIFFPERDALWEIEDNAFEEIYQPINLICESTECSDPTKHSDKQYEFKLCNFCGSSGIHLNCFVGPSNGNFTCNECQSVIIRSTSEQSSICPKKYLTIHEDCSKTKQLPAKKPKSFAATILGESDVTSSSEDDENIQPNVQHQNITKKPKSFAAMLLDESDCTSSDEENPTKYTYVRLS